MRSRGDFPKAVKSGSITVKVYRIKHASTASGWVYGVAWNAGEGRKMVQFADEPSAMEEARLKAAQLSAGRIEAVDMTRAERDLLQAAKKIAGDFPLLAALEEWRKVRDLTQGHLLIAAEAWAARNGTAFERIAANQVVVSSN